MLTSIPQCIISEIPDESVNDFDWVFLEIPVKSCIVGMLLTCPMRIFGGLFHDVVVGLSHVPSTVSTVRVYHLKMG